MRIDNNECWHLQTSINKIECVPTHRGYDFPPAEKTMTDFVVIDKKEHTTLVYP